MPSALEPTLDRAARRLRARRALEAAVLGAAAVTPLALVAVVAVRLDLLAWPSWRHVPVPLELLALCPSALGALGGLAAGLWPRVSRATAARVLDAASGRGAVLTTALEVEAGHPFAPLVRAEAERALADLSLRRTVPLRLPRRGARALAVGLSLLLGATLVPLPRPRGAAQQARTVAELGEERAAEVRRLQARMARLGAEHGVAGLERAAARLAEFSRDLGEGRLTELEALARLGEVDEELRAERERIEARARLLERLEAAPSRALLEAPPGRDALQDLGPAQREEARRAFARAAEETGALPEVQALLERAARALEPRADPGAAAAAIDALRRELAAQPPAHVDDLARAEVERATAELDAVRGDLSRGSSDVQLARADTTAEPDPPGGAEQPGEARATDPQPAASAGEGAPQEGAPAEPVDGPAPGDAQPANDGSPPGQPSSQDGPPRPGPSQPVDRAAQPGDAPRDAQPPSDAGDAQPRPDEAQPRPDEAQPRPDEARPRPDDAHPRPGDAQPRPRPDDAKAPPDPRPEVAEAAPEPRPPAEPPPDFLMAMAQSMGEDLLKTLDADALADLAEMARSMLGDRRGAPPPPSPDQARDMLDRFQGLDAETQQKLLDVAERLRQGEPPPAPPGPDGAAGAPPVDARDLEERLAALDPRVRERLEAMARREAERAQATPPQGAGHRPGQGTGDDAVAPSTGPATDVSERRDRPEGGAGPPAGAKGDDAASAVEPTSAAGSAGDAASTAGATGEGGARPDGAVTAARPDAPAQGRVIYAPEGEPGAADAPEGDEAASRPAGGERPVDDVETAGARRRATVPFDQAVREAEARALEALERQRVPEAYERVVREYFDRARREGTAGAR